MKKTLFLSLTFSSFIAFADDAREGEKHFKEKAYEKASESFLKAEIDEPKDFRHAYNRGVSDLARGEFDSAVEAFKKASKAEKEKLKKDALFNLGHAHYGKGDLESSLKSFQDYLKLDPKSKEALENTEVLKKLIEEQKKQEQQQKNDSSDKNDKNEEQDQKQQDQKQQDQKQQDQKQQDQKQQDQKQQDHKQQNQKQQDQKQQDQKQQDQQQKDQENPSQSEKEKEEESQASQEENKEKEDKEESKASSSQEQQQTKEISKEEMERLLRSLDSMEQVFGAPLKFDRPKKQPKKDW